MNDVKKDTCGNTIIVDGKVGGDVVRWGPYTLASHVINVSVSTLTEGGGESFRARSREQVMGVDTSMEKNSSVSGTAD